MSTQWLTMRSFQQSQHLLAAINTLSIHLKLRIAGANDQEREEEARNARALLNKFLKELDSFVGAVGNAGCRPVVGADSRTRQLARSFVQARRDRGHFRSILFRSSPDQVRGILDSEKPADQQSLLECLEELRRLLEAHIHTDARKILGEM